MLRNDSVRLSDSTIAISLLQDIIDELALKIISSTIDTEKNVFQIYYDNKIPPSSTYKKIRKLQQGGLVSIEKMETDGNGRKVAFYRSNIKSLDFNLKKESILLQLEQNDALLTNTHQLHLQIGNDQQQ
jgi:predicted transcriptional regulator